VARAAPACWADDDAAKRGAIGNRTPGRVVAVTGPADTDGSDRPSPTWEDIARSHGRFLYTVAYRLTGNRDDAEDLVQEVLLRVRRGLESYQPGNLEGWLSRIATNLFLDEVRRKKRRPLTIVADLPDPWVGTDADPEGELARQQLPEHIQRALSALPPDYRAAVVLCDVVGLEYAEIADALGVAVGTVRSRIHRGRALLRTALS
jgi:RNA polymerase sigma-70 factor (ECF subfamily)